MRKIFVVAAIIYSSHAHAQNIPLPADSARTLDEVILSASKYSVKTTETGKVVTVISRQDLEHAGSRDLAQVISEFGGVFINGYNNNPGKEKNIYLRGARVDYTLITIDGIPVYDASGIGSNFDIRNLSVDQVERIEILKGSQSTLYGSDAIAGVINIITRKGGTKSFSVSGRIHYGTYNTLKTNLSVQGKLKSLDYNIGFSRLSTEGFSEATKPQTASSEFDRDDYRQTTVQANFGFQITPQLRLQPFIRFGRFRGSLDVDAFTDSRDFTNENNNVQAGIRNILRLKKTEFNLLYQYIKTERRYLDDSTYYSSFYAYDRRRYDAGEHFAEAFFVIPLHQFKLTAGADFRKSGTDYSSIQKSIFTPDILTTAQSADSVNQQQVGLYAALNFTKDNFSMEGGGRLNHHSEYGNNFAFNINPSYFIRKRVKVFANLSTGYKTPSLYQLFSFYGNRFLQPEHSVNMEGGAQFFTKSGSMHLRAVYFRRHVQDAIAFYTDPSSFDSYYINQDEQKDHGIELDGTARIGEHLQLRAIYSYVNGEITTKQMGKDTSYFNLLRRPKSTFTFSAGSQLTKSLYFNLQLNAFGERKDLYFDPVTFQAKPVTLDSYILLNVYAEYGILKNRIKVFMDIRNMLDVNYSDVYGYNTAGFNAYGGLHFRF